MRSAQAADENSRNEISVSSRSARGTTSIRITQSGSGAVTSPSQGSPGPGTAPPGSTPAGRGGRRARPGGRRGRAASRRRRGGDRARGHCGNLGPLEDAADRQLRLLHLQPLPAAGGGQRRGADSSSATTRRAGTSCARLGFDNVVISPGPGRPERDRRLRRLRGGDPPRDRPAARRLHRPPGAWRAARRGGRARAGARARPAQRRAPRRRPALRRHPARVPGGPLPLALRRAAAAGRASRHRLDKRRRADGARAPRAAALGRPVPPGVGLHRARAAAARELSGSERGFHGPFFRGLARGTAGTLPPGQSPV